MRKQSRATKQSQTFTPATSTQADFCARTCASRGNHISDAVFAASVFVICAVLVLLAVASLVFASSVLSLLAVGIVLAVLLVRITVSVLESKKGTVAQRFGQTVRAC